MAFIVSSIVPFPNIAWWLQVSGADKVLFDGAEHFEKMSYRNKYFIAGSNGSIQLSIPLESGREQRTPMNEVVIYNKEHWQTRHWRTLVSVYKRSPYFDHYEYELQPLFEQPYTSLTAFNMATIHWLKKQLHLQFEEAFTENYIKHYDAATADLRDIKPGIERNPVQMPEPYYQMFADRNGFVPNLSMLDLLCTEGPHAMQWLRDNRSMVESWMAKKG